MMMPATVFWCTTAAVAMAAATDLRTRRIPNWLVAPFLAAGLLVQFAYQGVEGLWQSAGGLSVAVLATGLLHYLGGLGMGDCKLLAAVGVWIGPEQTLFALLGTALAGGVLALGYVAWQGAILRSLASTAGLLTTLARSGLRPHPTVNLNNPAAMKVPYALAIAVGTIFSFYTQ
jgi:prepilin peptidase CpaA